MQKYPKGSKATFTGHVGTQGVTESPPMSGMSLGKCMPVSNVLRSLKGDSLRSPLMVGFVSSASASQMEIWVGTV